MSGTGASDGGTPAPGDAPGTAAGAGRVHITVNGEPVSVSAGSTVAELLAARGAAGKPCAVEVNREIVPRSRHAAHALADGDAVEIVSFVGGG